MRILVTIDPFTPRAKETLERAGEVKMFVPKQKELARVLKDFDVAVVGLGLRFDRSVLEAAKNLKVIATATTGLDHIDTAYCEEGGIKIVSLRGETGFLDSITSTSELAFALALNLMRNVISGFQSVKKYEWDRERFRGHNMSGNTLGVVGVGRLGRQMVRYGKAFGMRVLGCDPNVDVTSLSAEAVSFDTLLRESDVVSIHVHLTPETENMFDTAVFKKMKSTAYLVNTSRGKIVNEDDLLAALESKTIAGYGADVLSGQLEFDKGFSNYPLVEYAKTHDNCIIVPHLGGMTFESRKATDEFIAKKLITTLQST